MHCFAGLHRTTILLGILWVTMAPAPMSKLIINNLFDSQIRGVKKISTIKELLSQLITRQFLFSQNNLLKGCASISTFNSF